MTCLIRYTPTETSTSAHTRIESDIRMTRTGYVCAAVRGTYVHDDVRTKNKLWCLLSRLIVHHSACLPASQLLWCALEQIRCAASISLDSQRVMPNVKCVCVCAYVCEHTSHIYMDTTNDWAIIRADTLASKWTNSTRTQHSTSNLPFHRSH